MTSEIKGKTKPKSGTMNDLFMRFGILGELLAMLWRRKLYWLIPMMLILMVFAVVIIIGNAGPAGVFIYTLF